MSRFPNFRSLVGSRQSEIFVNSDDFAVEIRDSFQAQEKIR